MTRSYEPAPSIEKDESQLKTNADDDNDTSFEIDEPEDEETIFVVKGHNVYTPTNETNEKITSRLNSPSGTNEDEDQISLQEEKSNDITPSTSVCIKDSHLSAKTNNRDESNEDSDCSYDSYTYSSTPTTADVADVTTVTLYHGGNSGCSKIIRQPCRRLPPSANVLVIAVQTSHMNDIGSVAEDTCSGSLETTTTDLETENAPSISPYNNRRLQSVTNSSNLMYNSTIHSIPSVLLTHPTAAFQETDSNAIEIPPTRTNRHQRTMSSTSQRSIASQHSVHTANTTLSITQPKSRIWTCLRWICLRFKSSGIGEPSVHHALVVIFLEFFAWGLLTMPVISVLNQTFPEHTFLMNGLVMGIKGILSFLSAPLIGALSDIWGRKFFLLITVFFTCAPIPLMTINTWWFFAMISISGIFAVTFSVVFAYVADVTTVEERSRAYGLVSATFAASLVISPALGAALMEKYSDTLVVALATAIAVLDVFFILVAVPESLPDKVRGSSWGAPINWEQADPFAALRKVGTDHTILMQCVTVLLSYLPEAGQYSCIFVYLKLKMGFNTMEVAIFIAVVGILSISVQVTLGYLMRRVGAKRTIVLGLILEMTQLFWYGFGSQKWMMWAAGILAALGSITYPAISAFVSIHSTADSQGAVQGMVTGMRGLCNGLGPAMFGVIFYLFNVDLNNEKSLQENVDNDNWFQFPGPPFVFGGFMVILAILVALFIPEVHGDMNFIRTPNEKKRASVDVQYEVEGGIKPTSPLMRSDSLAQL
ncbi:hippocampus abundant transcript 1 protein isoform X1 [Lucilia sericata]|uniref:hippocampus abundant transcript 1 protein isoform X1 n=2 Tax=Lucilia sericata TaxID=13632 RepID=UPI0018A860B4|nr:hippocampus abundant transcript 1 protein isoform X1 [Lucilia sericata]